MPDTIDVQDYLAICAVKARYCRFMDTKNWDGFADQFTEDFVLDTSASGGPPPIHGRDAAVAAIRSWVHAAKTAHQVHAPEMTRDGAAINVIWAMQDRVEWSHERRPRPDMGGHTGYGHYHERYVRCADGKWRITHQRLTRLIEDFHPPQDT